MPTTARFQIFDYHHHHHIDLCFVQRATTPLHLYFFFFPY
jgi:hypothetical protein